MAATPAEPARGAQGMAFARNAFGGDAEAGPDYDAIASAVFTSPPMAGVGLTQEKAQEEYGDIDVYTSSFRRGRFHAVIRVTWLGMRQQGLWRLRLLRQEAAHARAAWLRQLAVTAAAAGICLLPAARVCCLAGHVCVLKLGL